MKEESTHDAPLGDEREADDEGRNTRPCSSLEEKCGETRTTFDSGTVSRLDKGCDGDEEATGPSETGGGGRDDANHVLCSSSVLPVATPGVALEAEEISTIDGRRARASEPDNDDDEDEDDDEDATTGGSSRPTNPPPSSSAASASDARLSVDRQPRRPVARAAAGLGGADASAGAGELDLRERRRPGAFAVSGRDSMGMGVHLSGGRVSATTPAPSGRRSTGAIDGVGMDWRRGDGAFHVLDAYLPASSAVATPTVLSELGSRQSPSVHVGGAHGEAEAADDAVVAVIAAPPALPEAQIVGCHPSDDGTRVDAGAGKGRRCHPTRRRAEKSRCCIAAAAVLLAIAVAAGVLVGRARRRDTSSAPEEAATPHSQMEQRMRLLLRVASSVSQCQECLQDSTTPQNRAVQWMTHDDNDQWWAAPVLEDWQVAQRYAAAVLMFSTTDGEAEVSPEDLMLGNECQWNVDLGVFSWGLLGGFSCDDDKGTPNDVVTSLYLGQQFRPLAGTFPWEIGRGFPRLRNLLILVCNDLTGTVPYDAISPLKNLERLMIGTTGLEGPAPWFEGSSPNMRTFVLNESNFTGTIPSKVLGNMTVVSFLTISQTSISGTIPETIADLPDLSILSLLRNNLTGTIPSRLGRDQPHLAAIALAENRLSGPIPRGILTYADTLEGPQELLELSMNKNQITGTIPTELGASLSLEGIILSENNLTGTIPSELGRLGGTLLGLELWGNQLTGSVPTTLGNLVNLESFSLIGNQIHGDLNFLCDVGIPNILVGCPDSVYNLQCSCCECCPSPDDNSPPLCGTSPNLDSHTRGDVFLFTQCCMFEHCGIASCVD